MNPPHSRRQTRKTLQTRARDCAPMWVFWIQTIQVTHPKKVATLVQAIARVLYEINPDLEPTPTAILRTIRSPALRSLRTRSLRDLVDGMTHLNSMCLFDDNFLFLDETQDTFTRLQNVQIRRQSSTIRVNILNRPPAELPPNSQVDLQRIEPFHPTYTPNTPIKARYTLRPRLTY